MNQDSSVGIGPGPLAWIIMITSYLGTEYCANVPRLSLIEPAWLQMVQGRDGSPLLNEWFVSTQLIAWRAVRSFFLG